MSDILRWIAQEDRCGCGAACLAMIFGQTYQQVRDAIGQDLNEHGLGNELMDLMLAYEGFAVQRIWGRSSDPWPPAPWAPVHLCNVLPTGGYEWHYVVMDTNGDVYDPGDPQRRRLNHYSTVDCVAGIHRVSKPEEGSCP